MKNQKREKLNLEFKNMNYVEGCFNIEHQGFIVDKMYTHVFTSGHKLTIYPDPIGNYWYGWFTAPNGWFDAIYRRRTPEEILDEFKYMYENDRIYVRALKGFQE